MEDLTILERNAGNAACLVLAAVKTRHPKFKIVTINFETKFVFCKVVRNILVQKYFKNWNVGALIGILLVSLPKKICTCYYSPIFTCVSSFFL